ncbi:peptide-methionine (S)-S-oxide reductase MsrA [Candidatus Gracilibacteria bacterium 28_42_T64]|nr:peptide-methionine (S)-S-oxide reductase MsrA [Candidatus Gracilibacteria bacterium 28_42_T64]
MKTKDAIFALGCFWGVQKYFDQIDGVQSTEVGYTGGVVLNPTYDDLFDHSEAIKIEYYPEEVSYKELLEGFVEKRDPTCLIQVEQYKSAIYYGDEEEKNIIEKFLNKIQKTESREVVVEVLPQTLFYRAEEYHQKYYEKAGDTPYSCS